MKMKHVFLSLIVLVAGLSPIYSVQAERVIQFKPPQFGAPNDRKPGGTRSITQALSQVQPSATNQVQLIAAHQTRMTSQAAPTLYWYVSNIPPYEVEITVQQDGGKPLLKKNIGVVKSVGIQSIRLADYGVTLTSGQTYTWSVALITDSAHRANDLLANATIRYEKSSAPLTDVAQMNAAGYWYDAAAQLVESKSPQLAEFLQQEGINIPANK